jgi:hypothetical protein
MVGAAQLHELDEGATATKTQAVKNVQIFPN